MLSGWPALEGAAAAQEARGDSSSPPEIAAGTRPCRGESCWVADREAFSSNLHVPNVETSCYHGAFRPFLRPFLLLSALFSS